ncbi:hypothetical protein DL95DRAFT_478418 [Leptodontidium sp. 2 PMI_412]|nr:hypothetical protein DL95DRAFT_478418 [Leptodontidium sp. 2 PMI_412]
MALNLSPTNYYELTNSYTGSNFPLAVISSSSDLELRVASKDDSSLSWQFLPAQDTTKYNICTNYEGTSYCLDVLGNDKTIPHLATPAFVTGQQWTAVPSEGNTYKFSNDYSGSGYYLDIYSDTKKTLMSTGGHSGQYWTLNSEGEQPTVSGLVSR